MKTHFFIEDTHLPQRFPNASNYLDHSYCKGETSLTKLKNSKCDDFSGEIPMQLTDKAPLSTKLSDSVYTD
jgi:hypothetical protein